MAFAFNGIAANAKAPGGDCRELVVIALAVPCVGCRVQCCVEPETHYALARNDNIGTRQ